MKLNDFYIIMTQNYTFIKNEIKNYFINLMNNNEFKINEQN